MEEVVIPGRVVLQVSSDTMVVCDDQPVRTDE